MGEHPETKVTAGPHTLGRSTVVEMRLSSLRRAVCVGLAAALAAGLGVVHPGAATPLAEAAATSTVTCEDPLQDVPPVVPALESYVSVVPERVVDTRIGLGGYSGIVADGCTLRLALADSSVPTDAGAVALSVTAVSASEGFMTVFPCADGRPPSSNLNTRPDAATPNLVVAVPDANREVCIFSVRASDMVVDVQGWWTDGPTRFRPIEPVRAYDTRELADPVKLPAQGIRNVQVASSYVPADATSVVINLTAAQTESRGWMVAYPCGELPPLASNLNFSEDDTRAVAAIVGIGTRRGGQGQICFKTSSTTHFIVDVVGYYAPTRSFGPEIELVPVQHRLVDTRSDLGPWDRPFAAGEVRELDPTMGVDDAAAVVINAVGLNTNAEGFLTFFPCSDEPPLVSTLNTFPNRDVSNLLTVQLSDAGTVCVLSLRAADVVLDLVGLMVVPDGSLLELLDVTGADVFPPFDPTGTDYAMTCGAGLNEIEFTALPHRAAVVSIDGASPGPEGTLDVQPQTDDIVTVAVSGAGAPAATYYFRCLPADFPKLEVERPGNPSAGWYLAGFTAATEGLPYVAILNEFGAPVWYQRSRLWAINAQRLADGSISYDTADASGYGVGADEVGTVIDLDGNVLAEPTTDDPTMFPLDHHELLERPEGWTMLSYPLRAGVDVSVLGDGYTTDEFVATGSIREVAADGTLEWEWETFDYFGVDEVQFPVRFNNHIALPDLGEVDLFHLNSLDLQDDGDYVVSARHLDAVFRVDRTSGDLDWILSSEPVGGPVANKSGAPRLTIVNDPLGGPRRPHDARLNGTVLTLFDNRTTTGESARAVAYDIDALAGTATLLWQIDEPLGRSSGGLGAARVQPDGSRLVTWGGLQPVYEEFDAEGNLLLSVERMPAGNSYRVVKYGSDAWNGDDLRAAASST